MNPQTQKAAADFTSDFRRSMRLVRDPVPENQRRRHRKLSCRTHARVMMRLLAACKFQNIARLQQFVFTYGFPVEIFYQK